MSKGVIVTGHAGFVGRHLTRRLLGKGFTVYGFDIQKTTDHQAQKSKSLIEKKVDITEYQSVLKGCKAAKNIAFVFHTIAVQPVARDTDIQKYFKVNLDGALNLLNACEECGFKNLIVSSSFSVYGTPQYLPMDEGHPTRPNNVYGLSKMQAENTFEYFARKSDFHVVVLRYDGIYGADQSMPGFIQYLMKAFSHNEDVELFAKGKQKRDNVYVGDVVESNIKAMKVVKKKQFEVYNIGGDEPKTSKQTSETVKNSLRARSNIVISEKEGLLSFDIYMNSKKAKRELGYKPKRLNQNLNYMIKD